MKLGLAQLNTRVGATEANTEKVLAAAAKARDELGCDLVLFPELTLSGYPPEDLLLHAGLRKRVEAGLKTVLDEVHGIAVYIGFPEYADDVIYNSAALLRDGRVLATHRKRVLPNYAVFDEKRYFQPGHEATVVELGGARLGLIICEDAWDPEPARESAAAGADLLLVVNGSPYHMRQRRVRERVLGERAREIGRPVVYLNMVGGQDELVFDGASFALDAAGEVVFRAPAYEEGLYAVEVEASATPVRVPRQTIAPELSLEESVYSALVLGTRDYVEKNGFPGVVLGLSGGIDSALTLAIAVDALGSERVHAVMMPSRFTSRMSLDDAAEQARALSVRYDILSIETMLDATLGVLAPVFGDRPRDTTEENLQARCRGILLMAISNKLGEMLLSTGNKSEMAVGYAIRRHGRRLRAAQGLLEDARLRARALPQRALGRDPGARDHAPALGRARAGPARLRFAARLRRARRDPRGLHRARLLRRSDRGARLRARRRRARARDGQAGRVQAPPGAARRAREQPRVRARLALSDHFRVLAGRQRHFRRPLAVSRAAARPCGRGRRRTWPRARAARRRRARSCPCSRRPR